MNKLFSLKAECGQNKLARIIRLSQPVNSDPLEIDPLGTDPAEETLSDESMLGISSSSIVLSDWNWTKRK